MKNPNNYNITKIFKLENNTENRTLKIIEYDNDFNFYSLGYISLLEYIYTKNQMSIKLINEIKVLKKMEKVIIVI